MKKEKWDNWSAVIAYMVLLIGDFVIDTMVWTAHPLMTSTLSVALLVGTLYVAWRLELLKAWGKLWTWQTVKMFGLGLLLMHITQILSNLLMIWQYGQLVTPQNQQNIIGAGMPMYLLFLFGVCQGPVIEEVTMRGILIGRLLESRPILAIVLSSLVFGFLHGPTDLGSWVYYGGMGLVFAWLYYRTKHLEMVLLLHIFINFMAFLRMSGVL
ncbi:CPBP family intramembrane glutamic endopeptidase [Streptococcus ovuberis]|uniref:CPBP family intramembrane metalloprotease n=1 Tax=Streptococcus ovuberis TaxID=1936207 RepID=A0A7X6S184_9STRE|nr:CPBP family intramembrane glutamic endopeptidase [Streptococcus ovuberis]NKZ19921.1 CPBP family intramembrane metalloprotease [Streptococcus ovuberis]